MSELLAWSIDLGQWRGVRVRMHFLLVLSLALGPLFALMSAEKQVLRAVAVVGIYLLALAVHELGHYVAHRLARVEPEDILLGPWGNMIPPLQSFRPQESPWLAMGGILASGIAAFNCAVFLSFRGAMMVFNPFGNDLDAGAPTILGPGQSHLATAFSSYWVVGWFGWTNWVLFLINIIPALPLDGGRVLRSVIAKAEIHPRDSMIAPITARACAFILAGAGVFRLFNGRIGDFITLVILAAVIELTVRLESRVYEETGEFDTGAFGYDFSEGYTSLESSAPKVRPYRESALKRWRRKRSDLRRQRREAQESAEERRLDEILDKLHKFGKSTLTAEENRFLLRVSSRIRQRPKPGG